MMETLGPLDHLSRKYTWTLDNIEYTQNLIEFKVLKSRLPNDSGQTISVKEWFDYNYLVNFDDLENNSSKSVK